MVGAKNACRSLYDDWADWLSNWFVSVNRKYWYSMLLPSASRCPDDEPCFYRSNTHRHTVRCNMGFNQDQQAAKLLRLEVDGSRNAADLEADAALDAGVVYRAQASHSLYMWLAGLACYLQC